MQDNGIKNKISRGKKVKFMLFTLLFLFAIIFIIGEVILSFTHYPSTYAKMQKFSLTQAGWWKCDSVNGPRYIQNEVAGPDSIFFSKEIWYYNRLKIVNNEGYHDSDNFTDISPNSDSLRILVAGDSFTWGASADIGSSYVDVFENDLKKNYPAIVWNTGIPATGTNHALFTTKKYLPLQKSNYVVLGFYTGNDFEDNLVPFDQLIFNNLASCYNLYDYDKEFKPFKISKQQAFKKATGSYPMEDLNFVQKILIRSRFISFISDLKNKISNRLSGNKGRTNEQAYNVTKDYLKQLNDYVKKNDAELIVLIIPAAGDLKEKETHYLNAVKILNELSLQYIDPLSQLGKNDYLQMTDGHWNNQGHIKTGHMLSEYLLNYIKKKQQKTFKKN